MKYTALVNHIYRYKRPIHYRPFIGGLVIGIILTSLILPAFNKPKVIVKNVKVVVTPTPTATPTPKKSLYQGKISHYSRSGCLGCSSSLKMGNGKELDDNAMTIAVPCEDVLSGKIKYGLMVKVTNLDNGKSVNGAITDCGGFSKYNRVADLTVGMGNYLGTKTDVSEVKIEIL